MGMRIHKALGWGLKNVKYKKYKLADPRFNSSSAIEGDYDERDEKFTTEKYIEWLENKIKTFEKDDFEIWNIKLEIKFLKEQQKDKQLKTDFCSSMIYGTEYLLGNVFCCVPLCNFKQWFRHDDNIDYHIETKILKKNTPYVKVFDDPLYPYLQYWDVRNGKISNSEAFTFRRCFNDSKKIDKKSQVMDEIAKMCGYENAEDCINYMKPIVPNVIRWQLEFGNIFKDLNKTILELKPILYTYWS